MTLGHAFADKGHEVHYIVDDYGQAEVEKIAERVMAHKVALKYMGGPKYHILSAWLHLWRALWRINADIHLIKLPRNLLFPVGIFSRLFGKKFIFIGQIDADINPAQIRETEHVFSYYMYRIGMRWVDCVVAQNEYQLHGFQKFYNKRAVIIKNIITLPVAQRIEKKGYILWVGNSLVKKQPEKFVELARALPEYKFKMIMALSAQNPDDSFIRASLPSIPNLEYVGFVPFHEIARYYQEASLFISTSLREGFPNTFLQSWQYETPVVSLHVNPDGVIGKYRLGRVSGDFDRMCSDVRELMSDQEQRATIGVAARVYVESQHSADAIVASYLGLFGSSALSE